ncbi:hypothetical protein [Pseudogemmobacter bohemicus]|uniref:hypothetical protein n=1 Tax=Pseudogemmobacter bohemicus TaxID=2250708 RepID=UPI001300B0BE|nr:hypothetical protein [Pseudogemmobacter bohemicus]
MADPFTIMSGVGSLAGGIAGLFGARRKNPSPRDNIMSQVSGWREAADAYGFNPLTVAQYGNPGGTGLAASGPPLASFDMLASGFREIGDVVSGDADRRRAQEDAKLDLAKLEIERLQAGRSADALGGVSPLGNRPSTVGISGGTFQSPRVVSNPDRTSVQAGGVDVDPYEGNSDAEEYEKRYGDIVSAVVGIGNIVSDGFSTAASHALSKRDEYIKKNGKTPRQAADEWLSPLGIRTFSPPMTIDLDEWLKRRKAQGKNP